MSCALAGVFYLATLQSEGRRACCRFQEPCEFVLSFSKRIEQFHWVAESYCQTGVTLAFEQQRRIKNHLSCILALCVSIPKFRQTAKVYANLFPNFFPRFHPSLRGHFPFYTMTSGLLMIGANLLWTAWFLPLLSCPLSPTPFPPGPDTPLPPTPLMSSCHSEVEQQFPPATTCLIFDVATLPPALGYTPVSITLLCVCVCVRARIGG